MEIPRLGVELELQLLAYATATATWDLSHVCNLHHSSRQCPIFNPLSEARDLTHNLMVPSQTRFHCTVTGTPCSRFEWEGFQFLSIEYYICCGFVINCFDSIRIHIMNDTVSFFFFLLSF